MMTSTIIFLRFVDQLDIDLVPHLEHSQSLKWLCEKVNSSESFKEKVMTRTTILQVTQILFQNVV